MNSPLDNAKQNHPRIYSQNKYVYPVISRRSGGVSLGINVNLDKNCNFDCPYCQVDRKELPENQKVNIPDVILELETILKHFDDNGICMLDNYKNIPNEKKILQDIAISGDGEPTMLTNFEELCIELKKLQSNLNLPIKLVLITNSTLLQKKNIHNGINHLLSKKGAVWAKLDAGTQEWYEKVNVTKISLDNILNNLIHAGQHFPLTIQTLFFTIRNLSPDEKEISAYINRLKLLQIQNVKIPEIQLHTLARKPSQDYCKPLPLNILEQIQRKVVEETGLRVKIYT